MRHIARLAIRRPVPILIFWVGAFLVALLFVGKARDNLHETQLEIPGTAADAGRRAERAAVRRLDRDGDPARGARGTCRPRSAAKGRRLVRRLERIPDVDVLSPFAVGGDRRLREPPNQALLTLQVRKPNEEISKETLPAVERVLDDVPPAAQGRGVRPRAARAGAERRIARLARQGRADRVPDPGRAAAARLPLARCGADTARLRAARDAHRDGA